MRPTIREGAEHVYHLYVCRLDERDKFIKFAEERSVFPLVHYPVPIHLQPAYHQRVRCKEMRETEKAAKSIVSLPMYPELSPDAVSRVIDIAHEFATLM
jgi:dTDP-4-amino-4,6-dideoxygalactose transaminase